MMEIQIFIVSLVGCVTCWVVAGFFSRRFKKYLKKNPPVNEKMIREMMRQMGRTPSEKQVRQILASMDQNKNN